MVPRYLDECLKLVPARSINGNPATMSKFFSQLAMAEVCALHVLLLWLCSGLMDVTLARDERKNKTAICEITKTSGVYPIYGTIILQQQVTIAIYLS